MKLFFVILAVVGLLGVGVVELAAHNYKIGVAGILLAIANALLLVG